jgi:magnesium-transporting ATPase (P-type)
MPRQITINFSLKDWAFAPFLSPTAPATSVIPSLPSKFWQVKINIMAPQGKSKDGQTKHTSGQADELLSTLPHAMSIEQLLQEAKTDQLHGLTASEAQSRLDRNGPNELDEGPGISPVKILVRQVANAMTLVKRTTYLILSAIP